MGLGFLKGGQSALRDTSLPYDGLLAHKFASSAPNTDGHKTRWPLEPASVYCHANARQ